VKLVERFPSVPYVVPFVVFAVLLIAGPSMPASPRVEAIIRVALLTLVLAVAARGVIAFRVTHWVGTLAVGGSVFALWIAPDLLVAGWRESWIFQNGLTGSLQISMPVSARSDPLVLTLRIARAAILVPIIEELFWRAWVPRALVAKDFRTVSLGAYTTMSFVATAVLFASEHGPYWEVGLVAGVIYNWWMFRTRSLGDLILAHAVTNLLLSIFVLGTGRWEFWM
jgi:hypothetical protein